MSKEFEDKSMIMHAILLRQGFYATSGLKRGVGPMRKLPRFANPGALTLSKFSIFSQPQRPFSVLFFFL